MPNNGIALTLAGRIVLFINDSVAAMIFGNVKIIVGLLNEYVLSFVMGRNAAY
jgi:hypothetical protein